MHLGVHIGIAKGLVKGLEYAHDIGCESVQLFSGNPHSWNQKPLNEDIAQDFVEAAREMGIWPIVLHTPYLVNLASPDPEIRRKSIGTLVLALQRADALAAGFVVTHIGSHKGVGMDKGIENTIKSLEEALSEDCNAKVALELSSGGGNKVGADIESVAAIINGLDSFKENVGICIDTAHVWGAGYSVDSADGVNELLDKINEEVGLEKLLVLHLNDTETVFGEKKDRHADIGDGNLGLEGFSALINDARLAEVPGILETPAKTEDRQRQDLVTLRGLIG